MKVVVTGSRDYSDQAMVYDLLSTLKPTQVFVGDASGADKLVKDWCWENETTCSIFKADWTGNGKAAGPIRNRKMLDFALESATEMDDILVIAFPGGRGTNDCVKAAVERNMIVLRVEA